jgi:dsRNA-specific ribonuclease
MKKYNFNVNGALFNKAFRPLYDATDRFVISYGGSGSGKSVFAAQRYIFKMMESQHRNVLVVRKTGVSNRNSTFALFKQMMYHLDMRKYFVVNKSDMTITNRLHHNVIVFSGLDDIEKLKSITFERGILTDIWIEEASEIELNEFEQLNLRLRGDSKIPFQIWCTLNPITKQNWVYPRFFKETDERALIHKSTYLDNKFAGIETHQNMELLKNRMPQYYQVYALGEWGELTEGLVFKRQYFKTFDFIPSDAKGVIYCDPNLAKKGKGDTTAIVKMLYSPSRGKYYVTIDSVCKSMSQSDELIDGIVNLRNDERCKAIGMDGNVNQESHWSEHVRHYFRERGISAPVIEFKNYHVDELTKNAEWAWNSGDILFDPAFDKTEDGERALNQLFTFAGKKNPQYRVVDRRKVQVKDDFPDGLICAIEFMYERGYARRRAIDEQTKKLLLKHN